jgi:hypothetical protein
VIDANVKMFESICCPTGFVPYYLYMQVQAVLFGILVIWVGVLSVFIFWIFRFFRGLSSDLKRGNLIKLLDQIRRKEKRNASQIKKLNKYLLRLEDEGLFHIQKIGLIRFNPFKEIGGDHSFSLTLLDANDDGFILTGLHTRERTRMYIKDIKEGKSKYELSKEEKLALRKALK